MKSASEMICFQEVPDEVSLSFSISNGPYRCEGCHSPHLRTDCGRELEEILSPLLEKYDGLISCVLFMGGDDPQQLNELIQWVHICKRYGLKAALYSGQDKFPTNSELLMWLDYIKVGSYQQALGGLKNPNTNQRLYKKIQGEWKDITHRFWTSAINK
jgi:anaerobic ribonucleoside-triphosphate reductase activating protein